ncbi:MAG: class I SAM-dependent methyltransferase [Rhodanobacteraceae bacterium]
MRLPRILLNLLTSIRFPGSSRYWELRYRAGGDSGAGSYGAEADYKAEFLNHCIAQYSISSAMDFGCGDGNQLQKLKIARYLGFDVSRASIQRCRASYASDSSKQFRTLDEYSDETADAALSLDVLYHLVEDDVFDAYLDRLFRAAERMVIIYAIDREETRSIHGRHVRYRQFTSLIAKRFQQFRLVDAPPRPPHLPHASGVGASFFVFVREPRHVQFPVEDQPMRQA